MAVSAILRLKKVTLTKAKKTINIAMQISKIHQTFLVALMYLIMFGSIPTLSIADDKVPMPVKSIGDGDTVRLQDKFCKSTSNQVLSRMCKTINLILN